MKRARVLIVEDHHLVAEGLRSLLQPYHDVLDVVHDPRLVPALLARLMPDVVMLDLAMPHVNGLELLPTIRALAPSARVLVVTMHQDRRFAERVLEAGAMGFVSKDAPARELREAVATVLDGRIYLSPRLPRRGYRTTEVLDAIPALERLTPRQYQILRLTGEGLSSADVASQLGISPRTVEFHRAGIRRVLGLGSEAAMMRFAIMMTLADFDASASGHEGQERSRSPRLPRADRFGGGAARVGVVPSA